MEQTWRVVVQVWADSILWLFLLEFLSECVALTPSQVCPAVLPFCPVSPLLWGQKHLAVVVLLTTMVDGSCPRMLCVLEDP